jgi:nitrogen-specific signal transduction histidine kinase
MRIVLVSPSAAERSALHQGGTGLGLSIVQRVAADHGGSIDHERREGATVFRLQLPIVGGVAN